MKPIIPILLFSLLFSAQVLAQEACEPFDLRCTGNTVQQCNSFGTQWVDMENCSTGCSNSQCNPELRIDWILFATGIIILVVIVIIVRILWKRRKAKPPVPKEKHL